MQVQPSRMRLRRIGCVGLFLCIMERHDCGKKQQEDLYLLPL